MNQEPTSDQAGSREGKQQKPNRDVTSVEAVQAGGVTSVEAVQAGGVTSVEAVQVGGVTSVEAVQVGGVTSVEAVQAGGVTSVEAVQVGGVTSVEAVQAGGVTSVEAVQVGGVTSVEAVQVGGVPSVEAVQAGGVTFEEALQTAGGFGLYQKRLVCLICLTCSLVYMQNISPVITMKIPQHRCKIPGYSNDTYEIHSEFHAYLVNKTIPTAAKGEYSRCTVYEADDSSEVIPYDRTTKPCTDWVYDKSEFFSTFASQLNLVCERQIFRSHSSMAVSAGKLFGALFTTTFGDIFGRRRVYTVTLLVLLGSVTALVFPSSIVLLISLRFLVGAATTGSYLCCFVIGTELIGPRERRWLSTGSTVVSAMVSLIAVLIAHLTKSSQYFQATLAVPCIPVVVGYFFIPESPRWLASKGRHQEAQKTLDVIARANGVTATPRLRATANHESDRKKSAVSPLEMFRIPRLLVRFSLLYLSWMFIAMTLYGLMLNVSNMVGSILLNYTIMCSTDLAALGLFASLVDRVGRRKLLIVSSGAGGLACLLTTVPVVLEGNSWIIRGLSFCGRLCVLCSLNTLYIMSPELFPTVLRSFGLGSCSMMSRVGALGSPYVADLNLLISGMWGPALPQIVFGVAGVLTAVMSFAQPETKDRGLPDTVKDAAGFGRSKICVNDMKVETVLPSTAAITKSP